MFDIFRQVHDEDGLYDEEDWTNYRDDLLNAFAQSTEAARLPDQGQGLNWIHIYLDFAMSYHSASPVEITVHEQNDVLYGLIPRKVVVEAEVAGEIVGELRAFWEFMDREYHLPAARGLADELDDDAADDLRVELEDEGNFGMGKSLSILAGKQGYDISDEAELYKFMLSYNLALSASAAPPPFIDPLDEDVYESERLRGAGWTKPAINKHDKRKKAEAQRQAKKRNRR